MLQRWGEECCSVRQRAWWCHGLTLIAWTVWFPAGPGYRCLWLKKVAATATALWPHRGHTEGGQCKKCRWLCRWVHLNVILVITLTYYNFCFYKPTNRNAAWKTKYHRWRVNVTEKLQTWYPHMAAAFQSSHVWNHVHDAVSILMETGNGLQSL